MLPLVTEKHIALTHLIVCSFHINEGGVVHLNDYPPETALFDVMWSETEVLRAAGVRIMGMVGGAAPGSFDSTTLDSPDEETFAHYYGQLRDVLRTYALQGLDIDVEQSMSLGGIIRLIKSLRADFGADFEITLAPVATALRRGGAGANLSGFDYAALERAVGGDIAFYNAQFYNGFGSMASTSAYDASVTKPGSGVFAPEKVLAGQVTTPKAGSQWTPFPQFNTTVHSLMRKYPTVRTVADDGSEAWAGGFGGVMGWEYFNGEPGGTDAPWEWAQVMTAILRPEESMLPALKVTKETAGQLDAAWRRSVQGGSGLKLQPDVDYWGMVNA